ncbi:MAG: hypothetical protein ACTS6P_02095 [Candidatus Hodgkinia cicadicola]
MLIFSLNSALADKQTQSLLLLINLHFVLTFVVLSSGTEVTVRFGFVNASSERPKRTSERSSNH